MASAMGFGVRTTKPRQGRQSPGHSYFTSQTRHICVLSVHPWLTILDLPPEKALPSSDAGNQPLTTTQTGKHGKSRSIFPPPSRLFPPFPTPHIGSKLRLAHLPSASQLPPWFQAPLGSHLRPLPFLVSQVPSFLIVYFVLLTPDSQPAPLGTTLEKKHFFPNKRT